MNPIHKIIHELQSNIASLWQKCCALIDMKIKCWSNGKKFFFFKSSQKLQSREEELNSRPLGTTTLGLFLSQLCYLLFLQTEKSWTQQFFLYASFFYSITIDYVLNEVKIALSISLHSKAHQI